MNSTQRASVVISPRLLACEKPWFAQVTTRASGNSVSTSSRVLSVDMLSATTTSSEMSPCLAKIVDRQGRSQCPSFVEMVMMARSCIEPAPYKTDVADPDTVPRDGPCGRDPGLK